VIGATLRVSRGGRGKGSFKSIRTIVRKRDHKFRVGGKKEGNLGITRN